MYVTLQNAHLGQRREEIAGMVKEQCKCLREQCLEDLEEVTRALLELGY